MLMTNKPLPMNFSPSSIRKAPKLETNIDGRLHATEYVFGEHNLTSDYY